MTIRKKRVRNIVLFLLCFLVLFLLLNALLYNKTNMSRLQMGLYESPENSYDVLYVGGSHMNGAIDPGIPLESHGITGFNYATGGQEFKVTYYILKEALKRHSPKVVALDVFYIVSQRLPYGQDGHNHNALDSLHMSANKAEAIEACIDPKARASFYFPFLAYHNRWSNITLEDITFYFEPPYDGLGFGAGVAKYGKPMVFDDWNDVCAPFPPEMEEYLDRFVALAEEEGFELVLMNFPCDYTTMLQDEPGLWAENTHEIMNQVAAYAQEKGIVFLDFNTPEMLEALQFDFPNDMRNASHVNNRGAKKITEYFCNYMLEHYPQIKEKAEEAAASSASSVAVTASP